MTRQSDPGEAARTVWAMTRQHGSDEADIAREQAARLRWLRERLGLDRRAAAQAARVSVPTWSRMERADAGIDAVALARFCAAHELSADYVISGRLAGLPEDLIREVVQVELARQAPVPAPACALPRHRIAPKAALTPVSEGEG